MNSSLATIVVLCLIFQLGSSRIWKERMMDRPGKPLYSLNYTQTQLWFTNQKLDHFNPTENRTWSQRYYAIPDYFNQTGGAVFLYICGEGTCNGITNLNTFPIVMAQQYGALVLILEHRYYGTSAPLGESSLHVENMKYLTVDQALADLAHFTKFIVNTKAFGVNANHPWITIGGSYPGAMSAWYRYQYPHLTVGAWASSAVVNAILDFQQYDWQVRDSTSRSGPECPSTIQSLNYYAEQQLRQSSDSNKAFKARFNAGALTDTEFLSFFADQFAGFVQYGKRTILCKGIQGKTIEDQLKFIIANSGSATDYSVQSLRNDISPFTNGARQWNYQCCTMFGWWQTAQNLSAYSLRSADINVGWYKQFCSELFGSNYWPNVDLTNLMYGGTNLQPFNIIMTNGVQDPWKHASILKNVGNIQSVVIDCEDCGHCSDLHAPTDQDGLSLILARDQIQTSIGQWIQEHYQKTSNIQVPIQAQIYQN